MMAEEAKGFVVGVRGKGGARRPGLLPPHLLPVGGIDRLGLVAQDRDLLLGKAAGQKQIAFLGKLRELLGIEPHRHTS